MLKSLQKRKKALNFISELCADAHKVLLIHYSCESLSDSNEGYSPRITSIVVRSLRGDQQKSFSIHLVAEWKKIKREEIENHYDLLELEMLNEFYQFAKDNTERYWLNWNMKNINYGFEAIEHRYKVLGGNEAIEIPYKIRVNIPAILSEIYGNSYEPDPKMSNLLKSNFKELNRELLTGAEEAEAFKNKQFVKLHASTLLKTNYFAKIVFLVYERKLKISGPDQVGYVHDLLSRPLLGFIGIIASIVSIVAGIIELIKFMNGK